MANRMIALAFMSMLAMPLAMPVHAQFTPVLVDGCAKLARVIYSEVSAAATYGPVKSGPWLIDLGQGEISICTHAAKTVSRAFTSAMTGAGYDVTWHRDLDGKMGGTGDYCLNAFLSQCSPDRYPPSNLLSSSEPAFVSKTWTVVSDIVTREMYNSFSSDEVRFRDDDLRLQIGLSLRSVDRPEAR
jgi:hypothetical protein